MNASESDPSNPDYYFLIAYYLMEYGGQSSFDPALSNYEKALTLSPFNYNYWFYLAELFNMQGDREKAFYALNKATSLSPGTVSLRWKAGMLAEKLGNKESVMDNLSAVIKSDRKRRTKAFSLLWQSIGDRDQIFYIIPENSLVSYFRFLRATHRIDEAGEVFDTLVDMNYDTSSFAQKYVSDLIQNGDIESAKKIWEENYGSWEGVWNGNFDQNIMNDGFGWKLRSVEGARIKRDIESYKGKYAVMVEFDGTSNVDFRHLSQTIPVIGGSDYTIKMFVKSDDILTVEDLKWQVYCMNAPGLKASSEAILGTHDWKPMTISFKTPQDCEAVNLRLRRGKSDTINNLISGKLWVDEVQIVRDS